MLRAFYDSARVIIERFGGVVEKYIGDAVVGVFGVPRAHEDDPERAVFAALEIVVACASLPSLGDAPLRVRVGVNTGRALVRLNVLPSSGEGFLVGDAVNTAARLLAAAPPMGVIVGERTQALSAQAIDYEELPPFVARGKTRPVTAWLARGSRARTGMRPRPAFLDSSRRQRTGPGHPPPLVRPSPRLLNATVRADRRRGRDRQVAPVARVRPGARPAAGSVPVAPGPLPGLRRRARLLGAPGDRVGTRRHSAERRAGRWSRRSWQPHSAPESATSGCSAACVPSSASRQHRPIARRASPRGRSSSRVSQEAHPRSSCWRTSIGRANPHWTFLGHLVRVTAAVPLLAVATARPEFVSAHPGLARVLCRDPHRAQVARPR